jgi:hypothetical protein
MRRSVAETGFGNCSNWTGQVHFEVTVTWRLEKFDEWF